MLQIFKHRCNDISSLQQCKKHWGVEVDLRSNTHDPSDLHLSHDPWRQGESFKKWVAEFAKLGIEGPIILNTKEDDLETLTLALLNEAGVKSFLFLDTALPTFRKWTREKFLRHFFIRWSTIEPIELALANQDYCDWAWVDCFDRVPPDMAALQKLNEHFKTCLVSPELQGGTESETRLFIQLYQDKIKGVCTKFPDLWDNQFNG
jgi:hypothetical protein